MLLVLIGFGVGTLGTLIGVGGGFILIPILLFQFPNVPSAWISAVSMFVVAMNASSGSLAYHLSKRVHLRAAAMFILAGLPGNVLGVWCERFVSRAWFELIFGLALFVYSAVLLLRPSLQSRDDTINAQSQLSREFYWKGCVISFFVGFVASFFGIGGGVVHVPLLANVLGFPVHLATGTSHMILAVSAWFTTALHVLNGDVQLSDPSIWKLGLAAVVGAQLGARLSHGVSGKWIMRLLAVALAMVGARLVWLSYASVLSPVVAHGPMEPAHVPYPHVQQGEIGDFTLLDHEGVMHGLYRSGDAKAVVLIAHGNGCPILQKSTAKINALRAEYSARGIEVLMINPNLEDDRSSILKEATDYGLKVPILLDPSQIVSRRLGFTRTAEAVVLIPGTWKIVYRGAIDDELGYGVDKQAAGTSYLRAALEDVLAGRAPAQAEAPAKGCLISFWSQPPISYAKDIVPILATKCLNCHWKSTGFTPYFESYAIVRKWSAMIKETIFTDRMPPFSGDEFYGAFANDDRLTPKEKHLLVDWIDAGMPGDPAEAKDPLSDFRPLNRRARILTGRHVLFEASMPNEIQIPPGGTLEYQYFQLGDEVPSDMWVTAINTVTTNPRQLHHESLMIVNHPLAYYLQLAEQYRKSDLVDSHVDGDIPIWTLNAVMREARIDHNRNYVRYQNWGAGRPQPFVMGAGFAMFIPKGSYLVLEAHYMGTGRPETERTTLQFYGARQRRDLRMVHVKMLRADKVEIPAGAKDFVVESDPWIPEHDVELHGYLAHMHMRGRSIKVTAQFADGSQRTIVSIPNFYYGWQTGAGVALKHPDRIPAGTRLRVQCHYDNSAQNPNNPDPKKTVYLGQTVDRTEMCHINIQFSAAR